MCLCIQINMESNVGRYLAYMHVQHTKFKRGNMAMKGARFPLESTWKYHSFVKYRTTKLYCKTTNFWYLCELCSESSTGCVNMYRKIFISPYITMYKVLERININHINYQESCLTNWHKFLTHIKCCLTVY